VSPVAPSYGQIGSGRSCAVCDYLLEGLSYGGNCPECGAPIASSPKTDDAMSGMPESIIRPYRRGAIIAAIAAFIVLVTVIARFSLPAYAVIHHAILAGAGIVWFVGACWLTSGFETPASAGYGFSSRGRLRIVARWLQPAWTLYWLLTLIESVGSNAPATVLDLLGVGRLVSGLAAIGALMTIAIVLRRLAAWTRDDFAEAAFNWATFLLPIGPLLVPALTFPAFGVKVGIVAILLATLFSLPLGMVSLARSLFYAVGHSREAAARDENRRERAQRRNQQLHRRLDSVESPRRSKDEGRTR
jgi:membrane protein implicated in regulation of membrane protease activity